MADEKPRRVKRGRPKMAEWRRKDYELRVMLDRVEYAYLAQECSRQGLTLSELTRSLINQAIQAADHVYPSTEEIEFTDVGPDDWRTRRRDLERTVSSMTTEKFEEYVGGLLGVEWVEVDDEEES